MISKACAVCGEIFFEQFQSRSARRKACGLSCASRMQKHTPLREVVMGPDGKGIIPLTDGLVAVVDQADVEAVGRFTWHAFYDETRVYARTTMVRADGVKGGIFLHRFLWEKWGLPPSPRLDHRDGDGLNCRRLNLRAATAMQNAQNRRVHRNNKAGIKGVDQLPNGRWRAQIMDGGKKIPLGIFLTPAEASASYRKASEEIHGVFARTR